MARAAVVSARVEDDLAGALDQLAQRLDRPRGWIVAQAVRQYVTAEMEFLGSLDEAERQIDRGDYFSQDQMEAWAATRRGVASDA